MTKKKSVADLQKLVKEQEYELAEKSFYYFIKKAWGAIENSIYVDSYHIGNLAAHIQAHLEGEASLKQLIINYIWLSPKIRTKIFVYD